MTFSIFKILLSHIAISSIAVWAPVVRADSAPLAPSEKFISSDEMNCRGKDATILGLQRTDEAWLRNYLDLDHVKINSQIDIHNLHTKLMTTDIFTSADVLTKKTTAGTCELSIEIVEKWTLIPVIRGVYGGGTPLMIIGGYETNAFGRLLAMGGEVRRYGDRPPGGFLFFKSPRAWRGLGLWGGELWLDRRRRSFYNQNGETIGFADSEALTAKFQWLYPVIQFESRGSLQAGLQMYVSRESPSSFSPADNLDSQKVEAPKGLHLNKNQGYGGSIGAVLAADSIAVYGLNMDGHKGRAVLGVSKSPDKFGTFSEAEWFGYRLFVADINFAGHIYMGTTTDSTLGAAYYLGGFDSIRGLPDGIHFGNKIVYGNFEARVLAAKFKYAHIQPAVFMDTGSAWIDGDNPRNGTETSIGGGVRISIPQVYRLILRFDYGVSVGTTKSRGLSIGLNQFFQPYKLFF